MRLLEPGRPRRAILGLGVHYHPMLAHSLPSPSHCLPVPSAQMIEGGPCACCGATEASIWYGKKGGEKYCKKAACMREGGYLAAKKAKAGSAAGKRARALTTKGFGQLHILTAKEISRRRRFGFCHFSVRTGWVIKFRTGSSFETM